jgi:hypothetical protein
LFVAYLRVHFGELEVVKKLLKEEPIFDQELFTPGLSLDIFTGADVQSMLEIQKQAKELEGSPE